MVGIILQIALTSLPIQRSVLAITNAEGQTRSTATLLDAWTALTAAHAVGPERTVVFLRCGEDEVAGVVSHKGKAHDLAVITLYKPCRAVAPVALAEEDPEPGDDVEVVGFPGGQPGRSTGKVKGVQLFAVAEHKAGIGLYWVALVVSADVRPGNSGGPCFVNGKLVGIVHGFHEHLEGKPGLIVPLPTIRYFLSHPES